MNADEVRAESIFDKPGGLEAVTEWNKASKGIISADKECEDADSRRWLALVRLARAHKAMCDLSGPNGENFCWLEALYGERDAILKIHGE